MVGLFEADTTSRHRRYVGSTGEIKIQLITAVAALWSCHVAWVEEPDPDIALEPADVIVNPWRFHIPPTKCQGGLMLDHRENVTYPDGVQAPDGTIYIVYDHNRTPNGEVLMATFNEDDVRAGKPVSGKIRLRGEVARLLHSTTNPPPDRPREETP